MIPSAKMEIAKLNEERKILPQRRRLSTHRKLAIELNEKVLPALDLGISTSGDRLCFAPFQPIKRKKGTFRIEHEIQVVGQAEWQETIRW